MNVKDSRRDVSQISEECFFAVFWLARYASVKQKARSTGIMQVLAITGNLGIPPVDSLGVTLCLYWLIESTSFRRYSLPVDHIDSKKEDKCRQSLARN